MGVFVGIGDEVRVNVFVGVKVIVLVPVGVIVGDKNVRVDVDDGLKVEVLVAVDVEKPAKTECPVIC